VHQNEVETARSEQELSRLVPAESRDYTPILNQKEFSDITLMVEGKPIYCH
jgi:hypothetical protein